MDVTLTVESHSRLSLLHANAPYHSDLLNANGGASSAQASRQEEECPAPGIEGS